MSAWSALQTSAQLFLHPLDYDLPRHAIHCSLRIPLDENRGHAYDIEVMTPTSVVKLTDQ